LSSRNSVVHRLGDFLSVIKERMLPDYRLVQELAQNCTIDGSIAWLTTLNSAVTRQTVDSDDFSLRTDDYYCIDGVPVGRLLRRFLPAGVRRVTGTDLVPYLCKNLPPEFGPIVFVGEDDDIARASIEVLSSKYGRNDLIHIPLPNNWSPSPHLTNAEREFCDSVAPGVVFVSLSSPKSRSWFQARREFLPSSLYIGAGSALRVAGGHLSRVPKVLRDTGFEWVGRLLQDPLRLGPRYAADFLFLVRLAWGLSRLSPHDQRTPTP
jgi:exopolysaccharide biosynthesis WecB/TagA/CpsF family protein